MTFYNVKVPDDVPKTGDTMPFFLWGGIGILSIAGIACVLVLRRKISRIPNVFLLIEHNSPA